MSMQIFGVEVVTSQWCPRTKPEVQAHPEWRERLARNLARPSTGRWEPLVHTVEVPAVFMMGDRVIAHPSNVVRLYDLLSVA